MSSTKFDVLCEIERVIKDYRKAEYELLNTGGHHDFLHRPTKTRGQELLELRAECLKDLKDLAQKL